MAEARNVLCVRGGKTHQIIDLGVTHMRPAAICFANRARTSRTDDIASNNATDEFNKHYSMISVTTPEPTVLPPSLMANLNPSSIAIGVIRSISITTLSPGMHISVPAGS